MPEGVHRLVASVLGAPVVGIETVTGGPVRCMNRIERLVGRAQAANAGSQAHDLGNCAMGADRCA